MPRQEPEASTHPRFDPRRGGGLAREVGLQRGAEDVLLFRERRQHLRAVQDALAGAEAARVVLEGVVERMGGW